MVDKFQQAIEEIDDLHATGELTDREHREHIADILAAAAERDRDARQFGPLVRRLDQINAMMQHPVCDDLPF